MTWIPCRLPTRVVATLTMAAAIAAGAVATGVAQTSQNDLPACFGAAARAPHNPCNNPDLRLRVMPTPAQAKVMPNAPCTVFTAAHGLNICAFGLPANQATGKVAVIGDSHATAWRGAIEVVAQHRQWRGLSMTHSSCPLSKADRALPPRDMSKCRYWRQHVYDWFSKHPEVATVFVAALSGGTSVVPTHGRSRFETAVAGYISAWRALPKSVTHIIALRDTPKMTLSTDECIEHAVQQHKRPGLACARPRSIAIDPDPLFEAAKRYKSRRVQRIDLNNLLCGRTRCTPVIGGALVYKDVHHLTPVFASTLGPFMDAELTKLMTLWQ